MTFTPDIIFHIGPLPITNTLLHTLVVDGVLLFLGYTVSKNIKLHPKGLQAVIEPVIEGMYNLTESIASSKKAAQAIFPYVMTFFLFIFMANFTGLLPGVGTIGFFTEESQHAHLIKQTFATQSESVASEHETQTEQKTTTHTKEKAEDKHEATFVPLLRGATSDINVTLALATISVLATHMLSIKLTGIGDYLARWFSLNPVNLYVGLLELVAELTKIISLSFRLFGNIFAGEVALHTISTLFAFLAPLPFLLLESIVAVVQALVFSILTLVFMSVLTTPHHAHAEHKEVIQ